MLNINNTPNLVTDISRVLETSSDSLKRLNAGNSGLSGQIPSYANNASLRYFSVAGSGLGGVFELAQAGQIDASHFDVSGTGISAGSGASGLVIAPVLETVSGVSAAVNGAQSIHVMWTAARGAAGYLVSYSSDGGENWSTETIDDGTASAADIVGLSPADYLVEVTAFTTHPINADSMIQSASSRAASTVELSGNTVTGQGGTTTSPSSSSGGGGAVFWLALFPLAALTRRFNRG